MRTFLVIALLGFAVLWWLASSDVELGSSADPPQIVGRYGAERLGTFLKPRAVAVADDGQFYVVDRSGRIQHFGPDGEPRRQWEIPEFANGQPVGLTLERDGALLVSDSHYSRILRYPPGTDVPAAQWGELGTGPGQITFGRDVEVDSAGFVYVGDYGGLNDRILKFAPDGSFVQAWGSMGEEPGQFARPQGMTIEPASGDPRAGSSAEYLLVADCANHRVQRFTLDGELVDVIGRVGRGRGEFRYPMAVAVDSAGALYVCEWGNNRVQKLTPGGESLGFWGGPGAEPGRLSTPWDIEIGADDRLYVVDYGNHRVQIFPWQENAGVESGQPVISQWSLNDSLGQPEGTVDPRTGEEISRAASVLSGASAPELAAPGAAADRSDDTRERS